MDTQVLSPSRHDRPEDRGMWMCSRPSAAPLPVPRTPPLADQSVGRWLREQAAESQSLRTFSQGGTASENVGTEARPSAAPALPQKPAPPPDKSMERWLREQAVEPQTAFRSEKGYRNPRLRRLEALQRQKQKEALKKLEELGSTQPVSAEGKDTRSTAKRTVDRESGKYKSPPRSPSSEEDDDEDEPSIPSLPDAESVQPTPLPYKWTMPRNKLYREAYTGAMKSLSDADIEAMMNSGWLVEDNVGLRYAITGKYILHNIGKGKAPEDPDKLKPVLVQEHVARTLGRVNLKDEDEVQRPATPIEDPRAWDSDPGVGRSCGRKSVRFHASKRIFDERGDLIEEALQDNEGKSREMNRVWREERKIRRKGMDEDLEI